MTLEEAIKEIEGIKKPVRDYSGINAAKALQLGIEALKWFRDHRKILGYKSIDPLPGETKE